jgi:beta-lactam-binding protein with PASTA domain
MRTCENCEHDNADGLDFCEQCGHYLRWEPTSYEMPAVTPSPRDDAAMPPTKERPAASDGSPPAPTTPPSTGEARRSTTISPAEPVPRRRSAPEPDADRTAQRPPPVPTSHAHTADSSPATAGITLRLPDDEPSAGAGTLGVAVVPGERARIIALVRNRDTIVDNYTLAVHGLPREWYTVMPDTVYLVPFGSAGTYEQEVEIHIHPPRTPAAQAGRWELSVGVHSRAHGNEAATAPLTLGIHPYEDYTIDVRPQRASGRRRAKYDVGVANKSNAVILLALDAHDSDDECDFTFERDTVELGADESRTVGLRCRPQNQIWLGRALDRRFEIACASGEEGEKLLQAKEAAKRGGGLSALAGKAKLPGAISPPKVDMADISIGPGGKLDVRPPGVRGPQFQGVNLRRPTLGLRALRMPDRTAAPQAPSTPLLPTQAIFRQKAWLPWWLAIVLPLLLLLGLMLLLLLPKSVEVPNLKGLKTAFDAEKQLIAAELVLGERQKQPSSKAKPGTIIDQSPAAGESAKKGAPVSILIAVSNNDTRVPQLAGKTLLEGEKALRRRKLTKGALSEQPTDPKLLKIASTLPPAGETVKEGTPIDIFFAKSKSEEDEQNGPDKPKPPGPKDIAVPEIDPAELQGYGTVLDKAGLVPGAIERRISEKPRGTVIATDPAVGTKVAKDTKVKLIVSAGFPRVAFDDDENVLLASSLNGQRIVPAIAKTAAKEKDPAWSADGESVVYTADERLMSADMIQRDRAPVPLRPATEKYADPSFAPITTRSVLAVSRVNPDNDRDLCVGRVRVDSFTPQCIADKRFSIGVAHWSPGGTQILAFAVQDGGTRFGIVQYTSKRPFSARRSDWRGGGFVTARPEGKGVRDVAISPDGKRLAAISDLDTAVPRLYLTTPDDIRLRKTKPLQIPACKVQWIDSENLALVKFGNRCQPDAGEIVRVNVNDLKTSPIGAPGDNPTFQPLADAG